MALSQSGPCSRFPYLDIHLRFNLVLDDCNHAVSGYGSVDLHANSVFRLAPEPMDIEMSLLPFEHVMCSFSKYSKV